MSSGPAAAPLQRLVTLTFNGPVPYPHSAVTELTPDEQYEEYQARLEQDEKSRDAALQQEQASKGSESAFGKFSMFAKGVAHNVSKAGNQLHGAVEHKLRHEMKTKEKSSWAQHFPQQADATYVCTYSCKVMHGGQLLGGDVVLSSTHLNFRNNAVQESIPLASIVTIQRSVVLQTVSRGPPFILPIPAEHVIPSCLQIFTNDRQIFQFLEFASTSTTVAAHMTSSIKGNALERFYNFLDHAWRAATQVPSPGAEYQPPPHC